MKSIKIMLAGIGYILFGIACFLINSQTDYMGFFGFLGVVFDVLGVVMVIAGLTMHEQ